MNSRVNNLNSGISSANSAANLAMSTAMQALSTDNAVDPDSLPPVPNTVNADLIKNLLEEIKKLFATKDEVQMVKESLEDSNMMIDDHERRLNDLEMKSCVSVEEFEEFKMKVMDEFVAKDKVMDMMEKMKELEEKLNGLQEIDEEVTSDMELAEKVEMLEDELEQSKSDCQMKYNDLSSEVEILKGNLTELRTKEVHSLELKVEMFEMMFQEVDTIVNNITDQVGKNEQIIGMLSKMVLQVDNNITSINMTLSLQGQDIGNLKEKVKMLEDAKVKCETDIEESQNEINDIADMLKMVKDQIKNQSDVDIKLQEQIDNLFLNDMMISAKIMNLGNNVTVLETNLEGQAKKVKELEEEIDSLKGKTAEVDDLSDKLTMTMDMLMDFKNGTTDMLTQVKDLLEVHNGDILQLYEFKNNTEIIQGSNSETISELQKENENLLEALNMLKMDSNSICSILTEITSIEGTVSSNTGRYNYLNALLGIPNPDCSNT